MPLQIAWLKAKSFCFIFMFHVKCKSVVDDLYMHALNDEFKFFYSILFISFCLFLTQ